WSLSDSDPETGNFFGAKLHNDRFKTVVAARSTAGTQSQAAEWQRQIIKHHKNLSRRDLVKLRDCEQRIATQVHVACRFRQKHISAFRQYSIPLCRFFPSRPKLRCKLIGHHETNIVPGGGIFRPRVSQPGYQANL